MQNSTGEGGHIDAARSKIKCLREKLDTLAKGYFSNGQSLFEYIVPPSDTPNYSETCDKIVESLKKMGFTKQNATAAVQSAIDLDELYRKFPNLAES